MSQLPVEIVVRLHKLFVDKEWVKNMGQNNVYASFCKLLAALNDDEKELMLELIERYKWVTVSEYGLMVIDMFNNLIKMGDTIPRKIYLFPVKKIKDDKKVKSADSLLYLLRGWIYALPEPYNGLDFHIIDKFEKIAQESFKLQDDELFFMVDDFLGSGKTVEEALKEVKKNVSITNENIRVLSLVAHSMSIKLLDELGIKHSISLVQDKGITDNYAPSIRQSKLMIMEKLEKKITINKEYKFGYEQSEALVTLIKTPNNTFPVFWMDYKGSDTIPAPFPRHQVNKK